MQKSQIKISYCSTLLQNLWAYSWHTMHCIQSLVDVESLQKMQATSSSSSKDELSSCFLFLFNFLSSLKLFFNVFLFWVAISISNYFSYKDEVKMAVFSLFLLFLFWILFSSWEREVSTLEKIANVDVYGWVSSSLDVTEWTLSFWAFCYIGFSIVSDGAGNTSLFNGYIPDFSKPFIAVCITAALEKASLYSFAT